ncbi:MULTISPECIES: M50 family metallopeptidase [Metabacillus]|uniref:M50 family metallopeptidase n=2 Tax=Metabacillus TaxID=2675233 RepID=A0A179TA88_9BACI|nr:MULTISPECIES: M50 family metallopeptidase [Metabacillus]OAS89343.1 hypothetical protein A6K24_01975 [Metabacillus litoralis]QNF28856.1 M50 family metallopeptidase [Metabacillus sp. KUDC1714]
MENHLFVYLIVAYVISHVPFLGRYLAIFNTLIHESGHAIAALLLNGKVYSIKLFSNTAGEALTGQRGWISNVIISYAGYTFSSITAYACFMLLHKGYIRFILYALLLIALLNLILWIRNMYGAIWLGSFIALCGWTLHSGSSSIQTNLAYFLSSVLLTQSVSSALQIFMLSIVRRRSAGDATSLANYTKIPAIIWGFLFFAQAVYIAYLAINQYQNLKGIPTFTLSG